MGRNRKVTCLVCGKCMRSDTLKAHSLVHTKLLSLPEDEIKEELKACHAAKLERESQAAKVRKLEEIAVEEGLMSPQQPDTERSPDKETLRKDILERKQKFHAKMEFGGMVASIIAEEDADEQYLSPEQRDALKLFRRQQPQFEIVDVEQDEVSTPLETVAVEEHRMKFSCSVCDYIGWCKMDIQQHMFRENHGSMPATDRYRCRICGYITKRTDDLARHVIACTKKHEQAYREWNEEQGITSPSAYGTSKQSTDSKPPKIECSLAGCSPYTEGCERCTDYDGRYVLDDDQDQAREYAKYQSWKEDRRRNSTTANASPQTGYATYPQTGYATYPQTGYATYPQTGYATYPQTEYATYNQLRYSSTRDGCDHCTDGCDRCTDYDGRYVLNGKVRP